MLYFNDAVSDGIHDEVGSVPRTGFLKQVLPVLVHSPLADEQLCGDLLVRHALADMVEHFDLPFRQSSGLCILFLSGDPRHQA